MGLILAIQLSLIQQDRPGSLERQVWMDYFHCDRSTLDRLIRKGWNERDISVALFLAHRTQAPMEKIISYRERDLMWFETTRLLGASELIFYGVHDPGRYPDHRIEDWRFAPSDDELGRLVLVRITSDYYRIDPEEATRRFDRGATLRGMARQYHAHARGRDVDGKPIVRRFWIWK